MNIEWSLIGIVITIIGAVWSLAWWLSGKFSEIRHFVHDQLTSLSEKFFTKLEYHERHDDDRFTQIHRDFTDIRVRNAAKDTVLETILSKLNKDG